VSGFGPRRDPFTGQAAMHAGVDLRAAAGTPVTATAPGVVTMAETNGEYGNLVEVAHGFGLRTRYGHLSRVSVARGDRIEAGQTIGLVGSTGRSTGPHLHYEILFQQANLDPLKFLEVSRHVLANVQRRFE
jgi:murein DD-endopeptidase MepM/ murein hydrolase activator NlpD